MPTTNLGIVVAPGAPVSGSFVFISAASEFITLPAPLVAQGLSFPLGIVTASFMVVRNISVTDLTIQTSIATGATVMSVPVGGFCILYTVPALFVNTAEGGDIQVILGPATGSTVAPPSPPNNLSLFPMYNTFAYIMANLAIGQWGWATDEKVMLFNTGDATQGNAGIITR